MISSRNGPSLSTFIRRWTQTYPAMFVFNPPPLTHVSYNPFSFFPLPHWKTINSAFQSLGGGGDSCAAYELQNLWLHWKILRQDQRQSLTLCFWDPQHCSYWHQPPSPPQGKLWQKHSGTRTYRACCHRSQNEFQH